MRVFLLCLCLAFISDFAFASSCSLPMAIESTTIKNADIVFQGTVLNSSFTPEKERKQGKPDGNSTFRIDKTFKGEIPEQVTIYYSTSHSGISGGFRDPFDVGEERLIAAYKIPSSGIFKTSNCTLLNLNKIAVNLFQAQLDALNNLIEQYPAVSEFYYQKADILYDYKDFVRAEAVLGEALKRASPDEVSRILLAQGRALYYQGKYPNVLKVLKGLKADEALLLFTSAQAHVDVEHGKQPPARLEIKDWNIISWEETPFGFALMLDEQLTQKLSELSQENLHGQIEIFLDDMLIAFLRIMEPVIRGRLLFSVGEDLRARILPLLPADKKDVASFD